MMNFRYRNCNSVLLFVALLLWLQVPMAMAEAPTAEDRLRAQEKALVLELEDSQEQLSKELSLLWQAAIERSATVRYALEKLSRQDATGKPVKGDSTSKRLLGSLINFGAMASTIAMGSPAGLMSGNLIQQAMQNTNAPDASRMPLSETDMLILARQVDHLQNAVYEAYAQYKQAQAAYTETQQAYQKLSELAAAVQVSSSSESTPEGVSDLLSDWKRRSAQAQQSYYAASQTLGLLVGQELVAQLTPAS